MPRPCWGIVLFCYFSSGYVSLKAKNSPRGKSLLPLRDLIAAEDKRSPMSDDMLTKELAKKGYPIARRTVGKYREQLGIPVVPRRFVMILNEKDMEERNR